MAILKKITKSGQVTIPSHITKSIRIENGASSEEQMIIIKISEQEQPLCSSI